MNDFKKQKTNYYDGNWKLISFSKLQEFSDENYGKFNQSVDTEMLIEDYPQLFDLNLLVQKVMIHDYFMGKRTNPHYRTIIHCGDIVPQTLVQDLSVKQWESLMDLPELETIKN